MYLQECKYTPAERERKSVYVTKCKRAMEFVINQRERDRERESIPNIRLSHLEMKQTSAAINDFISNLSIQLIDLLVYGIKEPKTTSSKSLFCPTNSSKLTAITFTMTYMHHIREAETNNCCQRSSMDGNVYQ